MVLYTMVDIPEEDDLKEPEQESAFDQNDLLGGSGLFWCEDLAKPLEIEAEIIEFEDLMEVAKQLEY